MFIFGIIPQFLLGGCAARYGIITSTKGEMFNDLRMSIVPGTDQDEHCDYIVSWLRIRKGKMLVLRTAFPLYAYVDENGGRIGMEALPLRGLHRPCRVASDCFSHRRHHHRRHIGICRHPISTSAKPFSAPDNADKPPRRKSQPRENHLRGD